MTTFKRGDRVEMTDAVSEVLTKRDNTWYPSRATYVPLYGHDGNLRNMPTPGSLGEVLGEGKWNEMDLIKVNFDNRIALVSESCLVAFP